MRERVPDEMRSSTQYHNKMLIIGPVRPSHKIWSFLGPEVGEIALSTVLVARVAKHDRLRKEWEK